MRIFEAVSSGDVRDVITTELLGPPPPDHVPLDAHDLRHIIGESVRVTADRHADWIHKSMYDADRNPLSTATAGQLWLPSASMWIEWEVPGVPRMNPQAAAYVARSEPPEWAPAGSVQLLEFTSFIGFPDKIIYYPWVALAFIDEHGELIEIGINGTEPTDGEQIVIHILPAIMAIADMNCRN